MTRGIFVNETLLDERGINPFATVLVIIGCSTTYKQLQASLPDMSSISDGEYRGYYAVSKTPVKITLDVIVQDGVIKEIIIVDHSCSPIGRKAENIVGTIIKNQSLDIDAISGATASSKGILMAVENALQ